MKREKILIVDDEQTNIEFFEVMLSKLGFTVERAADGEEGLEKVVECNPDLIILDNIMPQLSGLDVTKILKNNEEYRQYSTIPIIMFSAMDDVQTKIEGFELGIEDYITKPFNFMEVLARVKAVLRHRDFSGQILQREKRLALTESLNKSLLYFTSHVKKPMNNLLETAQTLNSSDQNAVDTFLKVVSVETKKALATLEALGEEVQEQQSLGDKLKEDEISLEGLEKKYEKHFSSYRGK